MNIYKRGPFRQFDWDKAARIIKERGVRYAEAGLWEVLVWTRGAILQEGLPVREWCFLASYWATPVLVIENEMPIPCWVYGSNGDNKWPESALTKWPESALKILGVYPPKEELL